jgi:hypothetical protein
MNRLFLTAIAFGALATIAGCGEREQLVVYKDGKYQGKPDGRPWDSAPPANRSAGWKQGDQTSWENQLRTRSAGQNENRRIGH